MDDDGDDTERHDERLDPGEAPLGPGVGDLGQEEPGIPHYGYNLIPIREQTGPDSGIWWHLSFQYRFHKGRLPKKKTSYLVTLSLKVGGGQDEITLLGAAKIVTL